MNRWETIHETDQWIWGIIISKHINTSTSSSLLSFPFFFTPLNTNPSILICLWGTNIPIPSIQKTPKTLTIGFYFPSDDMNHLTLECFFIPLVAHPEGEACVVRTDWKSSFGRRVIDVDFVAKGGGGVETWQKNISEVFYMSNENPKDEDA